MPEEYLGTYKVRKLSKGEQVIHVPVTVAGDYSLYVDHNGTMTFCPIKGDRT